MHWYSASDYPVPSVIIVSENGSRFFENRHKYAIILEFLNGHTH